MVVLRADPWAPEYGMGFQARLEEELPVADPLVETLDWSTPLSPTPAEEGPVWFVDGVRRVELRLLAEDGGRRAPGLFGSFAIGSVCCDGRATFDEHQVGRAVVAGGGVMPGRVEVSVGVQRVAFEPATEPSLDPDRPLWKLQNLMQEAEAAMAARVSARAGRLVVVDGPLSFFHPTDAPVVGMVKRFSRHYLEDGREHLLALLGPGERTPLFALGDEDQPVQRYAWYLRLVPLRVPWHDQAGIVRCEVRAGVGLDTAVGLADRVTALLPAYAGRPTDPRAPQNLAPVGGLEAWLRHRMGDGRLLRRALLRWMVEGEEGG
ncbi:MAG: hypothetical protein H0W94_01915 [Actinobacteria bacterium]|nr:hypothetical protein [Actinomycetota bacterium]